MNGNLRLSFCSLFNILPLFRVSSCVHPAWHRNFFPGWSSQQRQSWKPASIVLHLGGDNNYFPLFSVTISLTIVCCSMNGFANILNVLGSQNLSFFLNSWNLCHILPVKEKKKKNLFFMRPQFHNLILLKTTLKWEKCY